jgi:hypothetical protein
MPDDVTHEVLPDSLLPALGRVGDAVSRSHDGAATVAEGDRAPSSACPERTRVGSGLA